MVGKFATVAAAKERVSSTRTRTVTPARTSTFDGSLIFYTSLSFDPAKKPGYQVGDKCGHAKVIAVNGDMVTVRYPRYTTISYEFDWAQVVKSGALVAEFTGGEWVDV